MIKIFTPSNPDLTIKKIQIFDTEEEYNGYIIEIHTSDGVISITGCHDLGPNVIKTELLDEDN